MIGSAFAVAGLALANDSGFADAAAIWTTWWLADAAGTVIIAPVIVLWATTPLVRFPDQARWKQPRSSLSRPQSASLPTALAIRRRSEWPACLIEACLGF